MIFSERVWHLAAVVAVLLIGPALAGCSTESAVTGVPAGSTAPTSTTSVTVLGPSTSVEPTRVGGPASTVSSAVKAAASHPIGKASAPSHPPVTGLSPDDVTIGRRVAAELMDAPGTATIVKLSMAAQRAKMPPCINVPVVHACLVVRVDQHLRQGLAPQAPGSTPAVMTTAEAVMDADTGRQVTLLEAPGTTPGLARLGVPVTTISVG